MRDKPENIRRKSVRQAVAEALYQYGVEHGTVSFCGNPTRVNNYYVVPAFIASQESLNSIPRIATPHHISKMVIKHKQSSMLYSINC